MFALRPLGLAIGARLALAPPALASEPDSSEELIVYADDFARWDGTRWWVEHQAVLPLPIVLGADDNLAFTTYGARTSIVLACAKDGRNRRRRLEVLCTVEDVALRATTVRHQHRPRARADAQRVLDELDAKLTGARLQLQVDADGGVNNVDIEDFPADNRRQRSNRESLRQLLLQALAGFHLEIPDHAQREGQWAEAHSKLMTLPSLSASRGSAMLVHTVSRRGAHQVVQTLGRGTAATTLPNTNDYLPEGITLPGTQTLATGASADGLQTHERIGQSDAPSDTVDVAPIPGGNELDVEATYRLQNVGVALFERATGVMIERVWTTAGTPTASSAGGTLSMPYRSIGRLRQLGHAEQPELGRSEQVAWPGQEVEGLPPWEPSAATR